MNRRSKNPVIVGICWILISATTLFAQQNLRDARSQLGMVVSVSPDASRVGAEILEHGGNAVDSAIATAFALAVTHPAAGNIGGGGFMLVHPGDGSPPVVVDYREAAPDAAEVDMYAGNPDADRHNHRYVGVPGTVRGLKLAHELYGALEWKQLVEPAVRLAANGFKIHAGLAAELNAALDRFDNEEFRRVFSKPDGGRWAADDRLVQTDLANTLGRIADQGTHGFYQGATAELIAAEMEAGGGLITRTDLRAYRARVRQPIRIEYRDYEILAVPPPSSGGITLAQVFGMVEPYRLKEKGRWSAETNHIMIEAMRRGFANRAEFLGDEDFVEVPEFLTSRTYARYLGSKIDLRRATRSHSIGPPVVLSHESEQTTHFSIVDKNGMAVSNTYTLEDSFGSGIVVRGGGFLLNNEMGDFNPEPGVTNGLGRIGTPPNLIAPRKRMLSSMSPVIVLQDGNPFLVTGSPGGRTIISTVFCVTLNVIEFGMSARQAVDAPRLDHEWFPDQAAFTGFDDPNHSEMLNELRAKGHTIIPRARQGDANTILIEKNQFIGAADDPYGAAVSPEH